MARMAGISILTSYTILSNILQFSHKVTQSPPSFRDLSFVISRSIGRIFLNSQLRIPSLPYATEPHQNKNVQTPSFRASPLKVPLFSILPYNLRLRLLRLHIQFPSRSRRIQKPLPPMDTHLLIRTRQHLVHSTLLSHLKTQFSLVPDWHLYSSPFLE